MIFDKEKTYREIFSLDTFCFLRCDFCRRQATITALLDVFGITTKHQR